MHLVSGCQPVIERLHLLHNVHVLLDDLFGRSTDLFAGGRGSWSGDVAGLLPAAEDGGEEGEGEVLGFLVGVVGLRRLLLELVVLHGGAGTGGVAVVHGGEVVGAAIGVAGGVGVGGGGGAEGGEKGPDHVEARGELQGKQLALVEQLVGRAEVGRLLGRRRKRDRELELRRGGGRSRRGRR